MGKNDESKVVHLIVYYLIVQKKSGWSQVPYLKVSLLAYFSLLKEGLFEHVL